MKKKILFIATILMMLMLCGCGKKTLAEKMSDQDKLAIQTTCMKIKATSMLYDEVNYDITENTITLTFKFKDDVASMWGIVSETENENMKETMETLAKTAKDSFEIEDPVQTVAVYKNNDDTVLDTFSYSSN